MKKCTLPLTRDPNGIIVGTCDRLEGGFKKPGAPSFTPAIKNESDLIWRDDDFRAVQEETSEVILIDNA